MRKWKRWTEEEDNKLLEEYKLKGPTQLAKEMPQRTKGAIMSRYRLLIERKVKGVPVEEVGRCPFCQSKNINKVITWYKYTRYAYYCTDCLKEFTKHGKLIPPLYADGFEG